MTAPITPDPKKPSRIPILAPSVAAVSSTATPELQAPVSVQEATRGAMKQASRPLPSDQLQAGLTDPKSRGGVTPDAPGTVRPDTEADAAAAEAEAGEAREIATAATLGAPRFAVRAVSPVVHGLGTAANAVADNVPRMGHAATQGLRRFYNAEGALFGNPQLGDEMVGLLGDDFRTFWEQADQPGADPVLRAVPEADLEAIRPRSWLGNMVSEITRYGATFALLRGMGLGAGASVASSVAQASIATQTLAYSANEARLSNLLQTHPILANPVSEFLQADPTDRFAEAKLKQVIEGVSLDLGAEALTFFASVRLQRRAIGRAHTEAITAEARRVDALARQAEAVVKPATVQVVDGVPHVRVDMPNQPIPETPAETITRLEGELRGAQRALETDDLTKLGSQTAWSRARAAAEADPNTAIITFDLNNFKALNDALGHSAGDDLLRRFGAAVRSVTDRGFRSGGDEFVVIAPRDQAESLRQTVEDLFGEHTFQNGEGNSFTASVSGSVGETFDAADAALQGAKKVRKAATGGVAPRDTGPSITLPAASRADAEATAATLNYEAQALRAPRGAMDEATTAQIRAAAREAATLSDPAAVDAVLESHVGNLNLNYLQTDAETNSFVESVYKVFKEELDAARGTRPIEESNARAVSLLDGVTEENASRLVERWASQSVDTEAAAQATRFLLVAQAKNVARLSAHAELNPDNAAAFDALARGLDYLLRTQESLTTTTASAGRTLRIFGETVTGAELEVAGGMVRAGDPAAVAAAREAGTAATTASESAASRVYENMTKGQIKGLARLIRFAADRPAMLARLMKVQHEITRNVGKPDVLQKLVRLRMNLLLSGPRTHLTNIISNAATALQIPAEMWWSGVKYGEKGSIIRGRETLVGLFTEATEAFQVAKRSLESGTNILDADGLITGDAIPGESKSWLSTLFSAPTRVLMAEDEFFKVLNYRAKVRAESIARSIEDGISDPAVLAARVQEDLSAAFARSGQALDTAALDYAKEATFTHRLESSLGQKVEGLATEPLVRLVVPFIRTPTNIFKYAWERTPGLNLLNKAVLRDLEAGGASAARRMAQVDIANAFAQQIVVGALGGQITGGGPKNPALRRQWLNAGNQPYSLRTSDGSWVSFRRMDPMMMPAALLADLVQLSGDLSEEEHNELASAAVGALVSNVSSKTFLQGLVQFADLFGTRGDGEAWTKFMTNLTVSSVIPSAVGQLDPDGTLREVRGLYDEFLNRTPGLSENLEPRRNFFGEPILAPPGNYVNRSINPFTVMSREANDPVLNQLVELGKAIPMPSRWGGQSRRVDLADRTQWNTEWAKLSAATRARRVAAGELPQSPYDRMMELLGSSLEVDGRSSTLRAAMTRLINSPEWAAMGSGTEVYPGGQRYEVAHRLIAGFTTAAKQQMLTEFPLLQTAIVRERTNALLARTTSDPQSAIRSNNAVMDSVAAGVAGGRSTGSATANGLIAQLLNPYGDQQ